MLTLLMAFTMAQAQLQEPDVAQMLTTVLNTMVAPSREIDGKTIGDRKLFIDRAGTADAFRVGLRLNAAPNIGSIDRTHTDSREVNATRCTIRVASETGKSCEIVDDGVFFTVLSASPTDTRGQYRIVVRLLFARTWPSTGDRSLFGGDTELFLTQTETGWHIKYGVAKVR